MRLRCLDRFGGLKSVGRLVLPSFPRRRVIRLTLC
ncbi:hypothetical protein SLEP1_g14793 [Rubroshorea leprosula]|uniref:Uncharacterized protein n=1 Tax=Rubroshorea leprosula TaxID=152421 RepID=A0AAV5IU43_9ROSI|nr:hypothetical protein SLEP1_g14793 [Rubroshorea leprosula]